MKKLLVFAFVTMLTLSLAACQKTVNGSDVCTFPETPEEIKCQVYSGGTESSRGNLIPLSHHRTCRSAYGGST